jgi:uncharacterized protein (TIGR00255 family)
MTGYGKAERRAMDAQLTVEVKSLNSKQLDISIKLPNGYRELESDLRQEVMRRLERGKVDVFVTVEELGEAEGNRLNMELARRYYRDLRALAEEIDPEGRPDYLSALVGIPEILKGDEEAGKEALSSLIGPALAEALDQVGKFREQEGARLAQEIKQRIGMILDMLGMIEPFEPARIERIKESLNKSLSGLAVGNKVDENRFQQELVYYLQKYDITEEKVRLRQHCEYFVQTLEEQGSVGKKLGFIAQEIGREINTLGSKAEDYNIQKIVVGMKDEHEKIREQLANVL